MKHSGSRAASRAADRRHRPPKKSSDGPSSASRPWIGARSSETHARTAAPVPSQAVDDALWASEHAAPAARAWAVGNVKAMKAHYAESRLMNCAIGKSPAPSRRAMSRNRIRDRRCPEKPGKTIAVVNLGPRCESGVLEKLATMGWPARALRRDEDRFRAVTSIIYACSFPPLCVCPRPRFRPRENRRWLVAGDAAFLCSENRRRATWR